MSEHDWGRKWGREREFRRQENDSLGLVFCMIFGPLIFVATCCGVKDCAGGVSGGCGCVNGHVVNKKAAAVNDVNSAKPTASFETCTDANLRRQQLQQQVVSLKRDRKLTKIK